MCIRDRGREGGADATETDMDADATPFDLCSFSASKAELLPAIERQLEGAFRASGMDAGTKDIEDMARCLCSLSAVDVSEMFSPPRFTKMAHLYNLRPGFCIDLTTQNKSGEFWDLSKTQDQAELEKLQDEERPEFLIGSPPCTDFCGLLRLKALSLIHI